MLTLYVGSGGLGDSVILSSKLLNIISSIHSARDTISYLHFESDKRKDYGPVLVAFWELVRTEAMKHIRDFTFDISFYKHGDFWSIVPRYVFNMATGLTTQVDGLCVDPPSIVSKRAIDRIGSRYVTLIVDGGQETRGLTINAIEELRAAFPAYPIVLLGNKKRDFLFHLKPTSYSILNLTGETTIQEALEVVQDSDLVIGPDGILTYYSAMHGVPTTLIFHEAPLIKSYCVHELPYARANVLIHPGYVNDANTLIALAKELFQT